MLGEGRVEGQERGHRGPPWSSHRRHPGLPRALGRPRRWHRGRRRASRAAGRHGPAGRARHPRPARTRRDRPRRRASGPLWHIAAGASERLRLEIRDDRAVDALPSARSLHGVVAGRELARPRRRETLDAVRVHRRPTERRSRSGLMLTTTRVSIRAGTRAATWSAVIAPIEWPSTWNVARPSTSARAMTSSTRSAVVHEVLGSHHVPAWPRASGRTTRKRFASAGASVRNDRCRSRWRGGA